MYLKTQLWSADGPASLLGSSVDAGTVKKTDKAMHAYDNVEKQDVVSTRSATTLVTMLFDKACVLLTRAIKAFETQDDQAFHQSALHALQIVLSLRFVLDTESGSDLSQSLFATYTSIAASLKKAKDEKDIQAIETIYEALDELRTAWHSVAQ